MSFTNDSLSTVIPSIATNFDGISTTTETPAPSPSTFLLTPETLIVSSEHENITSLSHFNDPNISRESLSFILPILVILLVALFSAMAIHCIQKRQRLESLRHTLIPLYTYTRHEEDDWGILLDNTGGSPSPQPDLVGEFRY